MRRFHGSLATSEALSRHPKGVRRASVLLSPRPKKLAKVIQDLAGFHIVGIPNAVVSERAVLMPKFAERLDFQHENSSVSRNAIAERCGYYITLGVFVAPIAIFNTNSRVFDAYRSIRGQIISRLSPVFFDPCGVEFTPFPSALTIVRYKGSAGPFAASPYASGNCGIQDANNEASGNERASRTPETPAAQIADQCAKDQKANNSTHQRLAAIPHSAWGRPIVLKLALLGKSLGTRVLPHACQIRCKQSARHPKRVRSAIIAAMRHISDVLADVLRGLAPALAPETTPKPPHDARPARASSLRSGACASPSLCRILP